jgi:hypothetical protein
MKKEELEALKNAPTYRTAREQRTVKITVTTVQPFEYMKDGARVTPDSTKVTGYVTGADGKKELVSIVVPNKGVGFKPASFATPQEASFTEEWDETKLRWYARAIEFVNAVKPILQSDDMNIAKMFLK